MIHINKKYVALLIVVFALILTVSLTARQRYVDGQNAAALAEAKAQMKLQKEKEEKDALEEYAKKHPDEIFSFSKKENNVLLITLDRAISMYFPYIMEELPETAKSFEGFTFYSQTLSYGSNTIFGTPPIFGGYAYTPEAINERDDELLVDKHNEALRLLPTIFKENGYNVTVCDPPIANYEWNSDLSIFDDLGITTKNFLLAVDENGVETSEEDRFQQNYTELQNLSNITNNMGTKGAFITFDNELPHRFKYLQMPKYEYTDSYPNNSGYTNQRSLSNGDIITFSEYMQNLHYHVNAASLRMLGEYFDYLRSLGVYDNTKIIIVADHGYGLNQMYDFHYGASDLMYYNPLLLVKDINAKGDIKYDNTTLMTTADVPVLATEGIIKDAKNPYSGKLLKDEVNKDEVHVLISHKWDIRTYAFDATTYGSYKFFNFKGSDIYDVNNWSVKNIYPTKKGDK